MRITVWGSHVPETGISELKDKPRYALPLEVSRGDLDIKKSFLPGEIEESDLITEELDGSISFYYGKVRDDELVCGGFYNSKLS